MLDRTVAWLLDDINDRRSASGIVCSWRASSCANVVQHANGTKGERIGYARVKPGCGRGGSLGQDSKPDRRFGTRLTVKVYEGKPRSNPYS